METFRDPSNTYIASANPQNKPRASPLSFPPGSPRIDPSDRPGNRLLQRHGDDLRKVPAAEGARVEPLPSAKKRSATWPWACQKPNRLAPKRDRFNPTSEIANLWAVNSPGPPKMGSQNGFDNHSHLGKWLCRTAVETRCPHMWTHGKEGRGTRRFFVFLVGCYFGANQNSENVGRF